MQRIYRWINLIGLIIVIIVNLLADLLPLGGKTTGQISAQYPVLIVPAGYAFSIWTIIYLLLIGFVIYSFTKKSRESGVIQDIGVFFVLTCIFNSGWLFAWHYEKLVCSVFVMFALLLSLIVIYIRVNARGNQSFTEADYWFVRLPFSIYLGWICVASIVNVASVLYAYNWDGFGLSDTTWTIIMLSIATLLAIWIGFGYTDPAIVLVFVWALAAIAVKQQANAVVANTSLVYTFLLAICVLYLVIRKVKK